MISPVVAILKKDMKAFLTSPMFYILSGLCCCLWGVLYSFELYGFIQKSYQLSMKSNQGGLNIYHHLISSYLVVVHYILIFIIAALSIRFFSEEKKLQTFPILLTSPIASWQIVLAKWLVGASVLFILLAISSFFPLSLLFFIDLPLGMILFGYFGVFIVLCVYMSAAMLASSTTESLIVSVVLTLVFSIFILLLGVGRQFTDSLSLQEFFSFLSFDRHFANFRQGVFSLSSVLYFLSASFVLSVITERIVEFHRWR